MTSSFYKFWQKINFKKWCARILISAAFIGLVYLAIFHEISFSKYKELINTLFTLGFIWLTYETLRSSMDNVDSPSLSIEFIGVRNLPNFVEANRKEIIWTEKVSSLERSNQENREYVFVKIENITDIHAIDVLGEVKYEKKSVGQIENSVGKVKTDLLKGGASKIEFITDFENCSEYDHFKLEVCNIQYSSSKRKFAKEKPLKENPTKDSWSPQQGTVIKFIGNKSI